MSTRQSPAGSGRRRARLCSRAPPPRRGRRRPDRSGPRRRRGQRAAGDAATSAPGPALRRLRLAGNTRQCLSGRKHSAVPCVTSHAKCARHSRASAAPRVSSTSLRSSAAQHGAHEPPNSLAAVGALRRRSWMRAGLSRRRRGRVAVPAQTWGRRSRRRCAEVGESRRRCGRVLAQMWASPGADVGVRLVQFCALRVKLGRWRQPEQIDGRCKPHVETVSNFNTRHYRVHDYKVSITRRSIRSLKHNTN